MVGLDQMRLWHAAREAARTAVVNSDEQAIRSAAARSGLSPLEISIDPDTFRRTSGSPLTVELSYRPDGRVPVLGSFVEGLSLSASATMRIERP